MLRQSQVGVPTLVVAALVLISLAAFPLVGGQASLVIFLAYIALCIFMIGLLSLESDKLLFLSPLVFFVLWHVLVRDLVPAVPVLLTGFDYHYALRDFGPSDFEDLMLKKFLLTAGALIFFYAGLRYKFKFDSSLIWSFTDRRRVDIAQVLVLLVCVAGFLLYANAAGGLGRLLIERGMERADRYSMQVGAHYVMILRFGVVASLLYLAIRGRDLASLSIFALSIILTTALVYLATGSRSFVVNALAMSLIVSYAKNGRMHYGKILFAGLALLIFLGVGAEYRKAQRGVSSVSDVQLSVGLGESMRSALSELGHRTVGFSGELGILGRVPSERDYLFGSTYLSFIAAPVPRALWEDKPRGGGFETASYIFERDDLAIPPGNVGELYLNFGYVGVVVGMFVVGVLLSSFHSAYTRHRGALSLIFLVLSLFYLVPNTESLNTWIRAMALVPLAALLFGGLPRFSKTDRGQE